MMNIRQIFFLLVTTIFLTSCATSPKFDINGIDTSISPKQAVAEMQSLKGISVLWGGVIIASTNLKDVTQLEILAYPLNSSHRPDSEKTPLGRFLAVQKGYLETTDYAQGRFITVKGILDDKHSGYIGETEYTYPVINITQLHLWSRQAYPTTRIQFGFGLMIHN